jgi:hypothetical protein
LLKKTKVKVIKHNYLGRIDLDEQEFWNLKKIMNTGYPSVICQVSDDKGERKQKKMMNFFY